MENGTYRVDEEAGFFPVQTKEGYWVAIEEVLPSDLEAGEYLGVWTDENTNKTYYDRSILFLDLAQALNVAKLNNQIAIWDNKNEREIYVK